MVINALLLGNLITFLNRFKLLHKWEDEHTHTHTICRWFYEEIVNPTFIMLVLSSWDELFWPTRHKFVITAMNISIWRYPLSGYRVSYKLLLPLDQSTLLWLFFIAFNFFICNIFAHFTTVNFTLWFPRKMNFNLINFGKTYLQYDPVLSFGNKLYDLL